jgi:ferrochelatase
VTIGVVVCDFGGPQSADELEPFLAALLADVLPGPSALTAAVAPLLARARAKRVQPEYEAIGWSPLVPTHRAQVEALRVALGPDAPPLASGMMFTPPTMDAAVQELVDQGVDRFIALPMFPHYSLATTNAAYGFLYEALERAGLADRPVQWIPGFHDHPLYIEALAATIRAGVHDTPGEGPVHLLFSPHGLPLSFVRRGDPYPDQVRTTVRTVIRHMGWEGSWHLGWQSRVGPVRWLEPSTPDSIRRLASEGVRRLCMVPVAFASEHLETLSEIDREYRELAVHSGIEHFGRAPALGLEAGFIECLAVLVRDAVQRHGHYTCMRCQLPQPESHRRQKSCPNCRFTFPRFLREGR